MTWRDEMAADARNASYEDGVADALTGIPVVHIPWMPERAMYRTADALMVGPGGEDDLLWALWIEKQRADARYWLYDYVLAAEARARGLQRWQVEQERWHAAIYRPMAFIHLDPDTF